MVLRAQISTFWCKQCGQLLCANHRNLHNCVSQEPVRPSPPESAEVRQQREAETQRKLQAEAARFHLWKSRRKHVAGKSSQVANFLQHISVQAEAGRIRDELLDLYTSCNRINLHLWNEVDRPTLSFAIDQEAWTKLRANYRRAVDLTGLVLTVDGMPVDLSLDWLPDDDAALPDDDAA